MLSGLIGLSILAAPLLLVLLLALFNIVAREVFVFFGLFPAWFLTWLRGIMPGPSGGGGLPPYQEIILHSERVALESLAQVLPCIAGLVLALLNPRPGPSWWWIVLLWASAAGIGGRIAAVALLPGILVAALFALSRR